MSSTGSLKTLLRHVAVLSTGESSGWILAVTMGGLRQHLEQRHSTEADPQSVYERVHPAPSTPLRSGSVGEAIQPNKPKLYEPCRVRRQQLV